jgi:hypothetical protein
MRLGHQWKPKALFQALKFIKIFIKYLDLDACMPGAAGDLLDHLSRT